MSLSSLKIDFRELSFLKAMIDKTLTEILPVVLSRNYFHFKK